MEGGLLCNWQKEIGASSKSQDTTNKTRDLETEYYRPMEVSEMALILGTHHN